MRSFCCYEKSNYDQLNNNNNNEFFYTDILRHGNKSYFQRLYLLVACQLNAIQNDRSIDDPR